MNAAALAAIYARKEEALRRRPGSARGKGHARSRLTGALACQVQLEDRSLTADLPVHDGGSSQGPDPGQLMRASLAASLAMGYRSWAARRGLDLDEISVDLSCDYDARGPMGLDAAVPVGWKRIEITVTVATLAPEAEVASLVTYADRLSPMLANLDPRIERVHHLNVVRPAEGRDHLSQPRR